MLKKVVGVVLAITGIATSTLLGVLLAAIFYWGTLGLVGNGSDSPFIAVWVLVRVMWLLAFASPLGGLIIGIRWARGLFVE